MPLFMCLLKLREMQHYKGRKENRLVHRGGREDVRLYFRDDEERRVFLSLLLLKAVHVNWC